MHTSLRTNRTLMPLNPLGRLSMTKFIRIGHVLDDLALHVHPETTTAAEVEARSALEPLWNDLFLYEPKLAKWNQPAGTQVVRDDELLRATREHRADAPLLLWCALLAADGRWERAVREHITTPDGRFDIAKISRGLIPEVLDAVGVPNPDGKPATNFLSNMAECGLFVPQKHGGSIQGVERFLPTSHAVPGLVRMLADRAAYWGGYFQPTSGDAEVDFALALGSNHWLGLTPTEFRRAAHPVDAQAQTPRPPAPTAVAELADRLDKKGQVVLQGPPGTGKTHLAKQYVGWVTSNRHDESRLQRILDNLPGNERTPPRVADEVQRAGLSAVWDIVQFHPSYEYNDFVRSLTAEPVAGGVTFTPRHGLLSFIAALGVELEARGADVDLVLILDELNRGNIPSIFGELLYALEYRGEPVATPYSIDGNRSITVPKSLQIIGTMNTADRSIAVIDYALRRRFVFLDVPATSTPIEEHEGFVSEDDRATALQLYNDVRTLLAAAPNGIQVGPSYFLPSGDSQGFEDSVSALASAFIYEVLPLLNEYAFEGEVEESALSAFTTELGIENASSQADAAAALAKRLIENFLLKPLPAEGTQPTNGAAPAEPQDPKQA